SAPRKPPGLQQWARGFVVGWGGTVPAPDVPHEAEDNCRGRGLASADGAWPLGRRSGRRRNPATADRARQLQAARDGCRRGPVVAEGARRARGQVTPAPKCRRCVDFEGCARAKPHSEPDDECNTFPHGKDKGPCTHRKPANISSNWSS